METASVTIRRRRRRFASRRCVVRIIALGTALMLLVSALIVNAALREPFALAARETVSREARLAFESAAARTLEECAYDLLTVTPAGGESFIITADTAKLNSIMNLASCAAGRALDSLGDAGVSVPLGTASGLTLLSGRGPAIRVGFTTVGSVEVSASSSLRSAGINQSLYSLRVRLTARVLLLLAGREETVTVTASLPAAETLVVGTAPQVYTNVADEEDMLNLIPTEAP